MIPTEKRFIEKSWHFGYYTAAFIRAMSKQIFKHWWLGLESISVSSGFRWKGGVGRWGQVLIDMSHTSTAVSSSLRWLSPGPCLEACVVLPTRCVTLLWPVRFCCFLLGQGWIIFTLSHSGWCCLVQACSAIADFSISLHLHAAWCSFRRVSRLLLVSPMYTSPQLFKWKFYIYIFCFNYALQNSSSWCWMEQLQLQWWSDEVIQGKRSCRLWSSTSTMRKIYTKPARTWDHSEHEEHLTMDSNHTRDVLRGALLTVESAWYSVRDDRWGS